MCVCDLGFGGMVCWVFVILCLGLVGCLLFWFCACGWVVYCLFVLWLTDWCLRGWVVGWLVLFLWVFHFSDFVLRLGGLVLC